MTLDAMKQKTSREVDAKLFLAIENGATDEVRSLVQPRWPWLKKADLAAIYVLPQTSFDGMTPLHYAAVKSPLDLITLLVECGASVNHKSTNGRTPLHSACGNTPRVVEYLIGRGAEVNAIGYRNRTPLWDAVNANANTRQDTTEDQIAIVKNLIAGGADVNVRDEYSVTPLHQASTLALPLLVALLLEKGGDRSAKDLYGKTPLVVAQDRKVTAGPKEREFVERLERVIHLLT
jgi:ankyrin repeat protein